MHNDLNYLDMNISYIMISNKDLKIAYILTYYTLYENIQYYCEYSNINIKYKMSECLNVRITYILISNTRI